MATKTRKPTMVCPQCGGTDFYEYCVEMRLYEYDAATSEYGSNEFIDWHGAYRDAVTCQSCGTELPEADWNFAEDEGGKA